MTIHRFTGAAWLAAGLFGQTATPPAFEVASVKASSPESRGMTISTDPGRLTAFNATLKFLIQTAYHVREDQVTGGPKWLDSTRYDVVAKIPVGAEDEDYRAMLQTLLADRFQLSLHRETRMRPAYQLMVAKGGVKIKDASASGAPDAGRGGAKAKGAKLDKGKISATQISMAQLAGILSNALGGPVQDQTGISGLFDVELRWTPDERDAVIVKPGAQPQESKPPSDPSGPSLFAALAEQLGLRLEVHPAPVEILVIERAHFPSGN